MALSKGATIGIIVFVLLILIGIGLGIYFYIRERSKKKGDKIDWTSLTTYCVKSDQTSNYYAIDAGVSTCSSTDKYWLTKGTFQAFNKYQPGTVAICVNKIGQGLADSSELITINSTACTSSPLTHLVFYAYPTSAAATVPGVVPICVGSTAIGSASTRSIIAINQNPCSFEPGWNLTGTFYAYPSTFTAP